MGYSVTARTVCRNREVAHRKVEGQTIIILPKEEEVMVLNRTGSAVWELSDGKRDAEEVARQLTERFDVPIETARIDLEQLYDDLIAAGAAHMGG